MNEAIESRWQALSKRQRKEIFGYAQHGRVAELETELGDLVGEDEHGSMLAFVLNHLRDASSDTLLLRACRGNAEESARWLLEKGSDPNVYNEKLFQSPLHNAAAVGGERVAKLLLAHGAHPAPTKYNDWTPLSYACQNQHSKVISLLLESMSPDQRARSISERNKEGSANLYLGCRGGSRAVVELLLANGADPDAANNNGRRAAHACAMNGDIDLCALLQSKGADLRAACDSSGARLWHEAAAHGHSKFISLFLAKTLGIKDVIPADSCLDNAGRHPLHTAARHGHADCVDAILKLCPSQQECMALVNAKDIDGASPLHLAAIYGHSSVLEKLLRVPGIDLFAKTNNGLTPLKVSENWKRKACQALLQQAIES